MDPGRDAGLGASVSVSESFALVSVGCEPINLLTMTWVHPVLALGNPWSFHPSSGAEEYGLG